jgi:HAE1 family hydrophobic/amphiphilic exporter-1
VASVERRNVLSRIIREDQQYQRTVAWEFRGPRKLGDLIRDAVVDATTLPPGYKIEEDDDWRWSDEEKTQVYIAIIFAVLLIYMVTAALFESLSAPFVVLLTLPLALIGVFLIFFYVDAAFTRTAYIGTIMMGGIVVNNAILIVYHIGELRQSMPTREAILQGTLERVRPILMTTFTTVFGLLPLILFAQSQDENIWNSLALATIGGLISSTLFVLVAIPVAYRYVVARRA